MSKWIVILHFQPLEYYPPITNFINFIAEREFNNRFLILTTACDNRSIKQFESPNENIVIKRLGGIRKPTNFANRVFTYLYFNLGSFLELLVKPIQAVLYYETLSVYPVYFIKRYIKTKIKIFAHYHEYTSPDEYKSGMRLNRLFHRKERWLYRHSEWISHTNVDRLNMFKADEGIKNDEILQILPNYPPLSWSLFPVADRATYPMRIVYAGAVGMDTMYISEFASWVLKQRGNVIWDIYSLNISEEAKLFLNTCTVGGNINVYDGVSYENLPGILKKYNVGVILYKGHIPNYIYNAPNKLFEYLACNLNVWYPVIMKSIETYINNHNSSRIVALDFMAMETFNYKEAFNEKEISKVHSPFFAENVLPLLLERLKQQ